MRKLNICRDLVSNGSESTSTKKNNDNNLRYMAVIHSKLALRSKQIQVEHSMLLYICDFRIVVNPPLTVTVTTSFASLQIRKPQLRVALPNVCIHPI